MTFKPTSLTALIEGKARFIDVDTSGSSVVMWFETEDGKTHRVEMFPDYYIDPTDGAYDFNRVEWTVDTVV